MSRPWHGPTRNGCWSAPSGRLCPGPSLDQPVPVLVQPLLKSGCGAVRNDGRRRYRFHDRGAGAAGRRCGCCCGAFGKWGSLAAGRRCGCCCGAFGKWGSLAAGRRCGCCCGAFGKWGSLAAGRRCGCCCGAFGKWGSLAAGRRCGCCCGAFGKWGSLAAGRATGCPGYRSPRAPVPPGRVQSAPGAALDAATLWRVSPGSRTGGRRPGLGSQTQQVLVAGVLDDPIGALAGDVEIHLVRGLFALGEGRGG